MSSYNITLKYTASSKKFDFSSSFSPAVPGNTSGYSITRADDSDPFKFSSVTFETAGPDTSSVSESFPKGTNEANAKPVDDVQVRGISVNSSNLHFQVQNQLAATSNRVISVRVTIAWDGVTSESGDPQITVEAGGGSVEVG